MKTFKLILIGFYLIFAGINSEIILAQVAKSANNTGKNWPIIVRNGDQLMEGDKIFRFFGLAAPYIQQNKSQIHISSPSLTDEAGKVPMRSVQLAYLQEIAKRVNDSKVHVVQIANYPGVPGDWHPSGTSHRAVANELEPVIRKALNW